MSANSPTPQERRGVEVVSEHLPAGYTAEFDGSTPRPLAGPASSTEASRSASGEESSLKLQGGDIHRDLFKLDAAARAQLHKRAATFHNPREFEPESDGAGLTVGDQLAPGGFRRAFLRQARGHDFMAARLPITRNFVEFLDLYGDFAGEDLADSDEEAVSEEEEEDNEPNERTALLTRRASARAARAARSANAGTAKTFFTLLKAFVGTGIMFLPNAFNNGGILFSSVAMVVVSAVTMVAFHILLECKTQYGGGYGELGYKIAGERMRNLILWSIALSQLGFVCAGIVFVAENLLTFLNAVTRGSSPLSIGGLIAMQIVILVPLSWIRNISKLGPAALLADICILIGVSYIYQFDFSTLASQGIHKTVVLFNPEKYTLMIGAAIFTFEGIGLILPIQSSMAKPERFEWLLGVVMFIITILFTSVGALCYATFGAFTQVEVINNFPQDSKLVNAVQFLYSVAVLVGTPVQLFPALRIFEGKLFGHRSGKRDLRTKWVKNVFRVGILAFCGAVAILGTGNLDKFVALIGSVACVPLVYVYPAYLHYQGVALTRRAKIGDIAMMVLGTVCMIYCTFVTVVHSFLT
ncbi:transmembrane amino acid transporter protein-domain-containing protein [Podospora aff. communis PSN243]|uniref:Transmembrane amino acid transporter protein-domain-containing protein n=1 Tax=Podospora aff. communis PSN243 TaxID=3040156 RepID=A0AAV9GIV0_9PEZI|nr:transmembrane amino acid transporter protein-domain-containing protein [Podospora aff. communis PSN243]